ncbi:hypothetical protein [Lactococcus lactis]|uniref:hypothetical protein n=1 Tax=Lactococcus lactis TaxID=1358 RepID=UPI00288F2362|nr:hypothetical protein [Lactococcus lactis]MDT2909288.1 hypothetical protein [Lactococcus lactis]MDT2925182.1 hypothetical protein [Lactococcus lactis]MDT2952041.1 hypothetical protein [Lactococcus lactis]
MSNELKTELNKLNIISPDSRLWIAWDNSDDTAVYAAGEREEVISYLESVLEIPFKDMDHITIDDLYIS